MKKVYISGKITGDEAAAKGRFAQAKKTLIAQGYIVVNPMDLSHDHDKTWESFMKVCIKALCDCDMIYQLPDWEDSQGAKMEFTLANRLGLTLLIL